jgi:hypothetical protein
MTMLSARSLRLPRGAGVLAGGVLASVGVSVLLAAGPAGPVVAASAAPAAVRIGTFDSRAVALAYYRSPSVVNELMGMRAELEKAKAAGDEVQAKDLAERGPAMQMLMHQQVFSNGSIGNITAAMASRLPEVAKTAGVVAIVSSWELPFSAPNIEVVDVTPQVVALFAPDAQTTKIVASMRGQKPIALLDALMIKD